MNTGSTVPGPSVAELINCPDAHTNVSVSGLTALPGFSLLVVKLSGVLIDLDLPARWLQGLQGVCALGKVISSPDLCAIG